MSNSRKWGDATGDELIAKASGGDPAIAEVLERLLDTPTPRQPTKHPEAEWYTGHRGTRGAGVHQVRSKGRQARYRRRKAGRV